LWPSDFFSRERTQSERKESDQADLMRRRDAPQEIRFLMVALSQERAQLVERRRCRIYWA
jgi:hypothetical protein